MWSNSRAGYGLISILLHWIMAVAVLGLFGLGWWMVDLSYYSSWYNTAPDIHKSVGVLLMGVLAVRLVWRLAGTQPAFEPGMAAWERTAALSAHWLMYLLMALVMASGYLIPTAAGDPISVFGWFEAPAITLGLERQEDLAGEVHYYGAWALVAVAAVHTLAALKHHFLERDRTLVKMLRPGP